MTWHAVSVDKNVTRTKLTSLSRSFRALDVGGGLAEIARSSYSPGARGEKRGNTADWIRGVPAPRIIRTIPATDLTDADALCSLNILPKHLSLEDEIFVWEKRQLS